MNFIRRQFLLLKYNKLPVLPKKSLIQKTKEFYNKFDILNHISLKGVASSGANSEYDPEIARFEKLLRLSTIHESKNVEKFFKFDEERISEAIELNKKIFDDFDKEEEEALRKKLQNENQRF